MPLRLLRMAAQTSSLRSLKALPWKAFGAADSIRGGRLLPRAPRPTSGLCPLIEVFVFRRTEGRAVPAGRPGPIGTGGRRSDYLAVRMMMLALNSPEAV